ncbi:MAG: Tad domain-containing protein [Candidatus Phosphoribacter sp.]
MHRLIAATRRRRARLVMGRERGSVAAIVAALFGGMAILGAAALSIDIGSLVWERAQLQSGADSASLAMARTCALNPADCQSSAMTAGAGAGLSVRDLANNTARDGTNGYSTAYPNGVCGNVPAGSDIPGCTGASLTTLSQCPPLSPDIPGAATYVEVHTRTRLPDGSTLLPPFIAQAIGMGGSTVQACARAAWGPAKISGGGIPFAISACEWVNAGGNINGGGAGAIPPPPYNAADNPWPSVAEEQTLWVNLPAGKKSPAPCKNFNGHDQPGGFGFLETTSNPCVVKKVGNGDWYHTDPGASVGCDLSALVGTVVTLPIFSCTLTDVPAGGGPPPVGAKCEDAAHGTHAYYYAQGYARFFLSGYDVVTKGGVPNKVKSVLTKKFPVCPGGQKCITGWFVTGLGDGGIQAGTGGTFGQMGIQAAG